MKKLNNAIALVVAASLSTLSGCAMMAGDEEVAAAEPMRPAMNVIDITVINKIYVIVNENLILLSNFLNSG